MISMTSMAGAHDLSETATDLQVIHRSAPLPSQRPSPEWLAGEDASERASSLELRDRLTQTHLRTAAEAPEAANIVRFRRAWWDGAARVPSLIVRLSTEGGTRRCRLVETGGRVVAVPAAGWRARRALARLRRPAAVDPALLLLTTKGAADPRLDVRPRVTVVSLLQDDRPRGRPTLPSTRRTVTPLVLIEQRGDAVRCEQPSCAGLVPIPPPGRITGRPAACMRCGRG
jgi:hypothetical protein